MSLTITHNFFSTVSDGPDTTVVRPSDWNAAHVIGGTLPESQLGLTDVTTGNVSSTKHGFAPKLPNDAATFLDGTGHYTTPLIAADNQFTGINHFTNIVIQSRNTAPADGALNPNEIALWFDPTNGAAKLMIKAKQADGTVRTGSVSLV